MIYSVYDEREDMKTLSTLARVSRAFSSPALDRLWCSLDTFHPLMRLLPRDSFETDEYHTTVGIVS
jgi:hypothetical protein